jgi:cytochrome c551/c552
MSLRISALVFLVGVVGFAGSARAQQADEAAVKRGKMLFVNRGCGSCHAIGKKMAGPDLAGVESRRSHEWLSKWLKETDTMLQTDSVAMGMLKEWKNIKMPKQNLTDQDVDALLAYVRAEEAKMSK